MMSVVTAIRSCLAQLLHQAYIEIRGVAAAHHFEDSVGAALNREMNMVHQIAEAAERAEEVFAESDRMR